MLKNYKLLASLFSALLFFSCQTEIEVKIPDYYNKIVVEGYIENGEYPVVSLFRSVPYFSTMSLEYLEKNVLINDAKVFVTPENGVEQELFLFPDIDFPFFVAYTTRSFVGEINTSYKLRIEWDGKTYTSETKILNTFDLDSVSFVPTFGELVIDSVANLRIWMKDDGAPFDYYQFKVKIQNGNDKPKNWSFPYPDRLWVTTIPSAFDNSSFRGISFNYEIIRGAPSTFFMPQDMTDKERRRYFRMNYRFGDTVYMKYARLDFEAYQFWQSINGELTFGQNPFMSPSPVISNIKCSTGEKCLGVWCGAAKKEGIWVLDSTYIKR
jgi:hypothetical protein